MGKKKTSAGLAGASWNLITSTYFLVSRVFGLGGRLAVPIVSKVPHICQRVPRSFLFGGQILAFGGQILRTAF